MTPSASGSAYLELEPPPNARKVTLVPTSSALKIICTVHGPKPLPRSATFTPHVLLSTYVKFAPFAARQRRGYVRNATERDLAVHLETALRGVIIGSRWPKSGVEIVITVLEGEEDYSLTDEIRHEGYEHIGAGATGMMSILSGCITVASAAIADAGIDCVDQVTGGIAAVLQQPSRADLIEHNDIGVNVEKIDGGMSVVLDPNPSEHENLIATCVVGYLESRDEITELWLSGRSPGLSAAGPHSLDHLIDSAIQAASAARRVLVEAVRECSEQKRKKE